MSYSDITSLQKGALMRMRISGADEISIYKAIKGLSDENTDPKNLELRDQHINQISSVFKKHGRSLKPELTSLFQMAKENE